MVGAGCRIRAVDLKDAVLFAAGALLGPAGKEAAEVLRLAVRNRLLPLQQHLSKPGSVESFIDQEVAPRLAAVPPERLQDPAPHVVVPALMAVSYTQSEELRAMFAALLAKSMDSATAEDVHPAFVDVIKQLTPDEARILKALDHDGADFFDVGPASFIIDEVPVSYSGVRDMTDLFERAGCENPKRGAVHIGNLERQNLVAFRPFDTFSGNEGVLSASGLERFANLIPHEREALNKVIATGEEIDARVKHLDLTPWGRSFRACCLEGPGPTASTPAPSPAPPPPPR